MRHYFVAFQYELLDSGIIRFENCEIKTKRDIVTYSDVEELLISQIQERLSSEYTRISRYVFLTGSKCFEEVFA